MRKIEEDSVQRSLNTMNFWFVICIIHLTYSFKFVIDEIFIILLTLTVILGEARIIASTI